MRKLFTFLVLTCCSLIVASAKTLNNQEIKDFPIKVAGITMTSENPILEATELEELKTGEIIYDKENSILTLNSVELEISDDGIALLIDNGENKGADITVVFTGACKITANLGTGISLANFSNVIFSGDGSLTIDAKDGVILDNVHLKIVGIDNLMVSVNASNYGIFGLKDAYFIVKGASLDVTGACGSILGIDGIALQYCVGDFEFANHQVESNGSLVKSTVSIQSWPRLIVSPVEDGSGKIILRSTYEEFENKGWFEMGDVVTILAVPEKNFRFEHWMDDSQWNEQELKIPAEREITIDKEVQEYQALFYYVPESNATWYIMGSFNDWTCGYELTGEDNALSVSIPVEEVKSYEFKLIQVATQGSKKDTTWFGLPSEADIMKYGACTDWIAYETIADEDKNTANVGLLTTKAGDYAFTVDVTNTVEDEVAPKFSVDIPEADTNQQIDETITTVIFDYTDFDGQGTSSAGSAITSTKEGVTFECNTAYVGSSVIRCFNNSLVTISALKNIISIEFEFTNVVGNVYDGGLDTKVCVESNEWSETMISQARINKVTITLGVGPCEPMRIDTINVAQALEIAQSLSPEKGSSATTVTKYNVIGYVVGISAITENTFYIADEQGAYGEFQAYKCKSVDSEVAEGDYVMVTGFITHYWGESSKGEYHSYEISKGDLAHIVPSNDFNLSVIVIPENAGSVTKTLVNNDTHEWNLVAVPNDNFHFGKWSDDIMDNPRSIVLTQNTTLTAYFEEGESGGGGQTISEISVTRALEIAQALSTEKGAIATTSEKYGVWGYVVAISDKIENTFYIADDQQGTYGQLQAYRCKSIDAEVAMGDYVMVTGNISHYWGESTSSDFHSYSIDRGELKHFNSSGDNDSKDPQHVLINSLYYSLNPTTKTAKVTYNSTAEVLVIVVGGKYDSYTKTEYNKDWDITEANIPSTVSYNGETYTVTEIGYNAFNSCSKLESVTIPNSITFIDDGAFFDCPNLTSITIPESVTKIGNIGGNVFNNMDVTILNCKTEVLGSDFQNCNVDIVGVDNVSLPDTTICYGSELCIDGDCMPFDLQVANEWTYWVRTLTNAGGCDSIVFMRVYASQLVIPEITISPEQDYPNSGSLHFYYNNAYDYYTINGHSAGDLCCMKGGEYKLTFYSNACPDDSLTTTRYIPTYAMRINNVYYILNHEEKTAVVTYRGASYSTYPSEYSGDVVIPDSIMNDPYGYYDGKYEYDKYKVTAIKGFAFSGCTGVKSITLQSRTPLEIYWGDGDPGISANTPVYVPFGTLNTYRAAYTWGNYNLHVINDSHVTVESGATSVAITFGDEEDQKHIVSCGVIGGEEFTGNVVEYKGLEPNSIYDGVPFFVKTIEGDSDVIVCSFTTTDIELTTLASKPVASDAAILLAQTNIADIETSCGFEWKRNDAPEDMAPNKVYSPVANGTMAGRLKNLNDQVYYKYRAFYESAVGNMYYGDWQYIFTGDNAVEYDPVLYTYAATAVKEHEATLKGYALEGSDEFTEQGFEYWADSRVKHNKLGLRFKSQLGEKQTVTVTGILMQVTLTDLDQGTTYKYRTFAKFGDQIAYGPEMSFTTQGEWVAFTVTFLDKDGNVIATQEVEPGDNAVAPDAPKVDGYKFIGWDTDLTNVQSNMTVTAQYAVAYTVRFVDWDGELLKNEQVAKGKDATPPEDPVRTGYNFTGWDKDYTNVQSDLTITAQYKIKTFTVRFLDWNDTELKVETVEYGKSATAPEAPTRDGYTFKGWDTEFDNVKSNLDVKAVYEKNADEAIDEINSSNSQTLKLIKHGNLYILRNGEIYNATGARVE